MARHKFLTHKQVLGQPFNEFVTELKNLSEDCELGTLKDSLVKDIIICGVNDRQLKERFLREDGVDLIKVIKIGQAAEQTKLHAHELHGGDPNVNETLRSVFDRIRHSGLKLNKSKCVFSSSRITFLGHVVSSEGLQVDPKKCTAITEMPIPSTKTELQRFLGMINYIGKFIPNLSEVTAPPPPPPTPPPSAGK